MFELIFVQSICFDILVNIWRLFEIIGWQTLCELFFLEKMWNWCKLEYIAKRYVRHF